MATFSYLRVSTIEQDTEKNKADVLKFANDRQLGNVKFIEETISGVSDYKKRELGKLITGMKPGDVLIVPELSRLARSVTQIFEIINISKQNNFILYSIKENFSTADNNLNSTITSTIFALVAQIERDLISMRTKEGLKATQAKGTRLGRPAGKGKSRLDNYKTEIESMLIAGVPKTKIAKKYNTSTQNLYNFLEMNEIK